MITKTRFKTSLKKFCIIQRVLKFIISSVNFNQPFNDRQKNWEKEKTAILLFNNLFTICSENFLKLSTKYFPVQD